MTSAEPIVAERRLSRDVGAGTLEYIGAIAVAAVVVLAIAVAARAGTVTELVDYAVCTLEAAVGEAADCGSPAGQTPYEQAVSGRYVAMGDSYSSGEGAWNYDQGTDFDDRDDLWPFNDDEEAHNRCHRSADAYARILSYQSRAPDEMSYCH